MGNDFRISGLISHEFFRAYALTLDFERMRLVLRRGRAKARRRRPPGRRHSASRNVGSARVYRSQINRFNVCCKAVKSPALAVTNIVTSGVSAVATMWVPQGFN